MSLPAYPQSAGLIEFQANAGASFRFFVDAASISVGNDGVVRYTLLARSATGVENVSYEGIRCATRSARAYAYGRAGAQWSPGGSAWRPIEPQALQGAQFVLWNLFFCPNAIPIASADEGVAALRRGFHPQSQAGSIPMR